MMTTVKANKMIEKVEATYGAESATTQVFKGLVRDLLGTEKENDLFEIFYETMVD